MRMVVVQERNKHVVLLVMHRTTLLAEVTWVKEQQGRRVRHAVHGCEDGMFCEGHNASSGLEPREKNVCGSVKCACLCERVVCSVYTPVVFKESPFLGSEMP